jgi:hypothetical protein
VTSNHHFLVDKRILLDRASNLREMLRKSSCSGFPQGKLCLLLECFLMDKSNRAGRSQTVLLDRLNHTQSRRDKDCSFGSQQRPA